MAVDVAVYQLANHRRSHFTTEAMARGIRKVGDNVRVLKAEDYRKPVAPVAVFYGFRQPLPQILDDYRRRRLHAVYIDLGYWGRLWNGKTRGYHKIVVNDRHPTAYFRNVKADYSRMQALGVEIKPWKEEGRHILLAGMGDKAAAVVKMPVEQWEKDAIDALRESTDRPIVYRPKPSWHKAKPLPGVKYSPPEQPLQEVLKNCHAVVTHHSNVAVDGLIEGIPAFCWEGVAKSLALQSTLLIEEPIYPPGRLEWAAAIAFTQWNVDEMVQGLPWRYMKEQGLIP